MIAYLNRLTYCFLLVASFCFGSKPPQRSNSDNKIFIDHITSIEGSAPLQVERAKLSATAFFSKTQLQGAKYINPQAQQIIQDVATKYQTMSLLHCSDSIKAALYDQWLPHYQKLSLDHFGKLTQSIYALPREQLKAHHNELIAKLDQLNTHLYKLNRDPSAPVFVIGDRHWHDIQNIEAQIAAYKHATDFNSQCIKKHEQVIETYKQEINAATQRYAPALIEMSVDHLVKSEIPKIEQQIRVLEDLVKKAENKCANVHAQLNEIEIKIKAFTGNVGQILKAESNALLSRQESKSSLEKNRIELNQEIKKLQHAISNYQLMIDKAKAIHAYARQIRDSKEGYCKSLKNVREEYLAASEKNIITHDQRIITTLDQAIKAQGTQNFSVYNTLRMPEESLLRELQIPHDEFRCITGDHFQNYLFTQTNSILYETAMQNVQFKDDPNIKPYIDATAQMCYVAMNAIRSGSPQEATAAVTYTQALHSCKQAAVNFARGVIDDPINSALGAAKGIATTAVYTVAGTAAVAAFPKLCVGTVVVSAGYLAHSLYHSCDAKRIAEVAGNFQKLSIDKQMQYVTEGALGLTALAKPQLAASLTQNLAKIFGREVSALAAFGKVGNAELVTCKGITFAKEYAEKLMPHIEAGKIIKQDDVLRYLGEYKAPLFKSFEAAVEYVHNTKGLPNQTVMGATSGALADVKVTSESGTKTGVQPSSVSNPQEVSDGVKAAKWWQSYQNRWTGKTIKEFDAQKMGMEKIFKHTFLNEEHKLDLLGKTESVVLDKLINCIKIADSKNLLKNGITNQIRTTIDSLSIEIRIRIIDGNPISLNAFVGHPNRNLGNIVYI